MLSPKDAQDSREALVRISRKLAAACSQPRFTAAEAVYNPLVYAKKPHEAYLRLSGGAPKRIVFLGMNPGPWGMAQTGVPFGEVAAVRDWLGIKTPVGKPLDEHPKRPVEGFACAKSEVSGRRLWGLFRERYSSVAAFFAEHFVANYCPLVFMDKNGANITPDKLPASEVASLFEICDRALGQTIALLKPQWVIGIGGFAHKRILAVRSAFFAEDAFRVAQILHPSPASPRANSGWAGAVTKTLVDLGVWMPLDKAPSLR